MAIYVGEVITVTALATDPVRSEPITDATAAVEFYAPPKNPKVNVDDREVDHTFPMTYDETALRYVGYADTAGWEPGKWAYRVVLSGSYDTWEYGTVTIKP